MKKISLIILAVATVSFVQAQTSSFGLKGGVNISNTTNNDTKIGYHVGALAHLHMSGPIALQPEVVYSSQGAKYRLSNGNVHTLDLNYVNVPFLVQYMTGSGLRVQTGPQVGFLTSVQDKVNGTETGFFNKNDFKDTDFSWSFGLGYMGRSGLGIDARYNLGLSNINPAPGNTIKNNVGQIGLFYQFSR